MGEMFSLQPHCISCLLVQPLEKVKAILGDKVSWADLIAVAGAEAVAMTGGPVIPVRLGRRDQG